SSQSAPPPQSTEKPAQKPQEKPKKVWTDDNIGQLSDVRITTATATPTKEGEKASGEAGAAPAAEAAGGKEKPLPPEKTPEFYKAKLAPLRQKLAETEVKIKEIQDAIANPYNGTDKINLKQQAPPGPPSEPGSNPPRANNSIYGDQLIRPQEQLAYYEKQRDDLQQQIDDLETQAIANGLHRGDIQ
ncbi:MAG TPA: hypothetical protein VEG63_08505, partial [Candidatus Acidoferrales bacterium]|nr:hypothetical protein [Candidatus Acidoferrales bacterium]